jgi:hypothetical protein
MTESATAKKKRTTIRGLGNLYPACSGSSATPLARLARAASRSRRPGSEAEGASSAARLSEEVVPKRRRKELPGKEAQLIVEIILRQRTGEVKRIGTLPSIRVGERVRIDGQDEWLITRSLSPAYVGGPRRVICERRARQRRAV